MIHWRENPTGARSQAVGVLDPGSARGLHALQLIADNV